MANTHFVAQAGKGLGTLTLKIYTRGTSTIINTGGDTATEDGTRPGWYDWTVSEAVVGIQDAVVEDAAGELVAFGLTPYNTADDTSTYVLADPSSELVDVRLFGGAAGTFSSGRAEVILANVAHGGSSATLRLGGSTSTPALYVTNSGGDAAKFEATGGNGIGLHVDGDGSGAGLRATGGATGNGGHFSGGASGGNGLRIFGASANALHCEVDANDLHGAYFQGQRDGHGIYAVGANGDGSGTGHGIIGASSGTGKGLFAAAAQFTSFTVTTNGIAWNSAWDTEVQSECDDALAAFGWSSITISAVSGAVGSVTGGINTSGGTITTLDALDTAQDVQHGTTQSAITTLSAIFAGITSLAQWLGIIAGKQTGNSTARTELRATGAGNGTYDETTDSLEAGRDNVGTNGAALTALLTQQMTEAYAANGVAPTLAQAIFAVHQILMQFSISGTNYTVKKLDNSTTAFVVTLNDGTSPTGATRT